MKNQYFGDINDYRKYGLLRIVGPRAGLSTAVCWMLTPDDGRSDGKFTQYLDKPNEWASFDPDLFHELKRIVQFEGIRDVRAFEEANLLPGAGFCSELVPQSAPERRRFMSGCLAAVRDADLLFFDPDNGMEIKSVRFATKYSPKYLYWREVEEALSTGHSLLIYQHFPRIARQKFIAGLVNRFRACTRVDRVTSFSTAHVVFFLLAQRQHREALYRSAKLVSATWRNEIKVVVHDEPQVDA